MATASRYSDAGGNLTYQDSYTNEDISGKENLLEVVFRNGELVKEQTLAEIRERLNNGKFGG